MNPTNRRALCLANVGNWSLIIVWLKFAMWYGEWWYKQAIQVQAFMHTFLQNSIIIIIILFF